MRKTPSSCWGAQPRSASRAPRALLVLLCTLGSIAAASLARAVEPVEIVIIDGGSPRLARKLHAEAEYAGFVAHAGSAGELGASAAGAYAAAVATLRVASVNRVELELLGAKAAAGYRLEIVRQEREGESFALRVMEQVRARLVAVGWLSPAAAPRAAGSRGPLRPTLLQRALLPPRRSQRAHPGSGCTAASLRLLPSEVSPPRRTACSVCAPRSERIGARA